MAVTTLDANTALLIIDLQQGIVALPVVHKPQPVITLCAQLKDAFHAKGLPGSIGKCGGRGARP